MPFAAASSSSAHPPPRDDYEEIREQVSIMIIAYNSGTITGHKWLNVLLDDESEAL